MTMGTARSCSAGHSHPTDALSQELLPFVSSPAVRMALGEPGLNRMLQVLGLLCQGRFS